MGKVSLEETSSGKRKAKDQNTDGIPPRHPDDSKYASDTDTSEFLFAKDIKTKSETSDPQPSRRDDFNKYGIAKNGTYLDLTNVPFKDQLQTIDHWAQSLSIIITNNINTCTKKKFFDYGAATLQGDVLQWLKQWK